MLGLPLLYGNQLVDGRDGALAAWVAAVADEFGGICRFYDMPIL